MFPRNLQLEGVSVHSKGRVCLHLLILIRPGLATRLRESLMTLGTSREKTSLTAPALVLWGALGCFHVEPLLNSKPDPRCTSKARSITTYSEITPIIDLGKSIYIITSRISRRVHACASVNIIERFRFVANVEPATDIGCYRRENRSAYRRLFTAPDPVLTWPGGTVTPRADEPRQIRRLQ